MSGTGNTITIEILSNGASQVEPCVIVRTQMAAYVFNVPEGTQRFIPAINLTPANVHDVFITRGTWCRFGGLAGLLISKSRSDKANVRVHGAPCLDNVVYTSSPFLDKKDGETCIPCDLEPKSFIDEVFEDNFVFVHYIPVFEGENNGGTYDHIKNSAFLVEFKPKERRIDPKKLAQLKIKNGPLIGQLKAGKTITLPDGLVVNPEDVLEEVEKDMTPSILIVDLENINQLPSIVDNDVIKLYLNGAADKTLGYVVHLTPDNIVEDAKYKMFMTSFGEECQHLIVNGSGEALPMFDGPYNNQNMLNHLDPFIFPKLALDFTGDVHRRLMLSKDNIIRPRPFERFFIRGNVDKMLADQSYFTIGDEELKSRMEKNSEIENAIALFHRDRETTDLVDPSDSQFPSISFLGTASACPTKYRSVSGYLVRLSTTSALMVDCGEGSYGQIKVLYGPEVTEDIMIGLGGVFITHGHLDHIYGLFTLVEERVKAFQRRGLPYDKEAKLLVAGNIYVKRFFDIYCQRFNYIKHDVRWVYTMEEHDPSFSKVLPSEVIRISQIESVTVVAVDHIPMATGFVFETLEGQRIVFSGDTKPCKNLVHHGKHADVLVHEATFEDMFAEDAERKRHCTTGQAIQIGKEMKAKHIILTHFSARYPKCPVLSDDIINDGNVTVATDFMVLPWNRRKVADKLAKVYKELFQRELNDFEKRN